MRTRIELEADIRRDEAQLDYFTGKALSGLQQLYEYQALAQRLAGTHIALLYLEVSELREELRDMRSS